METQVSISTDLAVILIPPVMSPHDYVPAGPTPPLPPPMPIGIALEAPCTIFWPPGYVMGKHKLTDDVKHLGFSIALEGHDCGPGIPHFQTAPSPTNALTPVHVLTSSRKVNFSAGEVKANGKPIAHCILGLPPTPMTNCGKPVSPPGTSAVTSHLNSLLVGVHPIDLIAGWASIAVNWIIDALKTKVPDAATRTAQGQLSAQFTGWANKLGPGASPPSLGGVLQGGAKSSTVGLVRLAGQLWFGYHGDASFKIPVSAGSYSTDVSASRAGEDGRIRVGYTRSVSGPAGLGRIGHGPTVSFGGGRDPEGSYSVSGNLGALSGKGSVDSSDGLGGSGGWDEL